METKAKKSTQEERLDYLVEEFKADDAGKWSIREEIFH